MSTTDFEGSKNEETRWTDARIRWPVDSERRDRNVGGDDDSDDDDEGALQDPFKDDDPTQTFTYHFPIQTKNEDSNASSTPTRSQQSIVDIEIRGYKDDSDEIWESTGLTVWRAAEHLCKYMANNVGMFEGKRILELGAGLGLCGIMAYLMTTNSAICVTDGDTDALACLRENADRNRNRRRKRTTSGTGGKKTGGSGALSCHQLIWGKETAVRFLNNRHDDAQEQGRAFDVIIASDIVYAECIVGPLWETVQTLLNRNGGIFIMVFARRKVPVSIDCVLESATKAGFEYSGGEDESEPGIFTYTFRWKEDCET